MVNRLDFVVESLSHISKILSEITKVVAPGEYK